MVGRPLHKLATWLCLVATLLLGISPRQAWVLCLEPDGRVSFELASDASRCDGCPEGSSESREPVVPVSEPADCPCIDIPLVLASDQDQVELKRVELPFALSATLPVSFVHTIEPAPASVGARSDVPRPAQSLTLIRSVVLLV
jgi:hypothetical protein